MQLVGRTCVHCRERVARETDSRFCPKCGSAVHLACSKRALVAAPSGSCRACGAEAVAKEQLPHVDSKQQEAKSARGYHTIFAGVALMIGGVLGSMCFFGTLGDWQILAAGGALSVGVFLVVIGALRSRL